MLATVLALLLAAVVIYFSCEAFVNGVEWLGHKLNVSETATGTVLAAFGTALPESVVTLVAAAFGDSPAQKDIGVGAALGGPLALSTIAYGVVAVAFIASSRSRGGKAVQLADVNLRALRRDQIWFLSVFVFKVALGLVVFAWKPWLGALFLAVYGVYVVKELRSDTAVSEASELEPLMIRRRDPQPALPWSVLQVALSLVVIFAASQFFVHQVESLGPQLGMSAALTSLLFSPIATELPEVMNAIIWVRQGKQSLALSNISGAMMIQATVPTAFGLFWTRWHLAPPLLVAAAVTAFAILYLIVLFRRQPITARSMAVVALFYLVFAAAVVAGVR